MKANNTQKLRGERKTYTRPKIKVYKEGIADVICSSTWGCPQESPICPPQEEQ